MKFTLINLFSILLFIFASLTEGSAQDELKTRFGIKAGVNASNLYTKDVDDENMLIGFNLGVFSKIPITSFIAIQPELYYTTKGAENTYNNTFVNGSAKFNVNYIELPLLLVINFTKNLNLHVGPYASYLLSGKVSNESNITLFDFEDNIDTDDYNKIDAGIAGGLGVDFGSVGLGLRYNYGLANVGKEIDYNGTAYTFPDGKNSVLSLNLNIGF